MNLWEGFSISLIETTFLWYSHIGTLVVSQSVKQCMTVDLGNVVDIQKQHLLLHRPVLNKTSTLSSARMFVCKTFWTANYTFYICISDKTNLPCLLCLVEYWFHQTLEGDRKSYYGL